ncbi:pyruvate dehydrogenase (acetyl-transferring) E1 component subunit alpha [Pelomicrobium methylotrophicum]|uniref:Pyruvate dehydrogenase E1 component subunit alpha n=1 Tax=Pelomicrobium methylotrophicum TaxID=2602750 RepID=A0A5C7EW29_9PROT|nr:pyruvate dehydrogenase (acetyl-transferring) E1 component subunit alpha [Pelomicrobium methylotrophicum]TXF12382.1 pyruvate dehydrogenase (acetyl-transferring) E1 component subunit alpha [Pelomicrobium methylotrophicum]
MSVVATFQIEFRRFLDPAGHVTQPLPPFAADPQNLIPLYRMMVLTRTFDAKAIALQRTGRLGTFASSLGQEAVSVGVGSAMRDEDVLLPAYREYGAQFWRGVTMTELFLYWSGDERGMDFSGPRHDFPICVPIATQVCHAAGVAYAFQLRREPRVAVAVFGDGATSKGDFYEAINIAGAWRLPAVFVINNNQWAISMPRLRQTAAQTLAQKAIAAGIPGEQVDGNDVIAVRHAVEQALAKARAGGGPTLIEALTYRLGDHTTADDASRYRDAETVKAQWAQEPVSRLRTYLVRCGAWDREKEEALEKECASRVQAAVEEFLAIKLPGPEQMFDHLYATLPPGLQEQRAAAVAFAPRAAAGQEEDHG